MLIAGLLVTNERQLHRVKDKIYYFSFNGGTTLTWQHRHLSQIEIYPNICT